MAQILKVSDYLADPVAIGVIHERLVVDIMKTQSLYEWLLQRWKENAETKTMPFPYGQPSATIQGTLQQHLDSERRTANFAGTILSYMSQLSSGRLSGSCPKPIVDWNQKLPARSPFGFWTESDLRASVVDADVGDVLLTALTSSERELVIDAFSLNGKLIGEYEQFIKSIPGLGSDFSIVSKKTRHSAAYSLLVYPHATSLWLRTDAPRYIPDTLLKFVSGALNYIWRREWRTSVVLSAITVEFILAEIYEEEHTRPAPESPLGDLYREVKQKHRFPESIAKSIEETNDIRIRAVHRSTLEASEREAINALKGAVQLTLYHCITV